jgi:hypothetical protein
MPVDQTGETVLFVLEEGQLQTHIQIRYDPQTEAERFAWVIPVMAIPEFSVGSQALFDALLTVSAPSYGFNTRNESCTVDDVDPCGGDGDGIAKFDVGGGDDTGSGEPTVVEHAQVGAFEATVLDGGTAQGVFDWLEAGGFAQDEAAIPILQEYISDGFLFVAIELAAGAGAEEIHPIVLTQPVSEPCVPIKLTRIASRDDLELRTLFLADGRVVPDNYAHVIPNGLELNWLGLGLNYTEWVGLAVDEAGAGQGFVTEYAGAIPTIDPIQFRDPGWNAEVFRGVDWQTAAVGYYQQFYRCYGGEDLQPLCSAWHPLADSLQQRYLPVPEGVAPDAFFECPQCFETAFDDTVWDSEAFADGIQLRIIEPAERSVELVQSWPWLTRMFTTLSPHEMTMDPTFAVNIDAPAATDLSRIGTVDNYCDGTSEFELPDGRRIALPGTGWPDIGGDAMPAAEIIERYGPAGAPVVEVDRRQFIQFLLDAHNDEYGPMQPPDQLCGDDDGGETFATGPWDEGSAGASRDDDFNGCVCNAEPSHLPSPAGLLLLLAPMLRRRRRV